MSDTVVPRTYPYRPSGGWTQDEIWVRPTGPAHDDIPDGMTAESKDRLKQIGFSALDSLLEAFQSRIRPQTDPQRAPGEVVNAGAEYRGPDIPVRVDGTAAPISGYRQWIAVRVRLLLIGALLLEHRR